MIDPAAAPDQLTQRIIDRLTVPMTPSELAAVLGVPVRLARAFLYQMRRQGRVERTDRTIKLNPGRGRPEYLWQKRYLGTLV